MLSVLLSASVVVALLAAATLAIADRPQPTREALRCPGKPLGLADHRTAIRGR